MEAQLLVILVIEDNPDHAELIRRSLEEYSIDNTIVHMPDGEMALDYVFGRGEYYDREKFPMPNLILLDLRLPKVDGLQVLKTIKHDDGLKHIPVVILTSSESEKDISSAYQSFVNSYLVKPMDYEKFLKLVEELGLYWMGWNRQPTTIEKNPEA